MRDAVNLSTAGLFAQLEPDEIRRMEAMRAGLNVLPSTAPADGAGRLTDEQQRVVDSASAATTAAAPTSSSPAPRRAMTWVDQLIIETERRLAARHAMTPAPSGLPHAGTADERKQPITDAEKARREHEIERARAVGVPAHRLADAANKGDMKFGGTR
jgi:hypothetical protein